MILDNMQQKAEKVNQAMIVSSRTVKEGSLILVDTVKAFDQIAGSIGSICFYCPDKYYHLKCEFGGC
jgi:hypothetical protein